jgi:hypothetical protein
LQFKIKRSKTRLGEEKKKKKKKKKFILMGLGPLVLQIAQNRILQVYKQLKTF